ncbi:MAG: DUF2304 family protein [Candidatus Woesearchaeota archaeon]|nr:MAG: DUF2304 family protein [Candidatus Woesearchaeota archaeon]
MAAIQILVVFFGIFVLLSVIKKFKRGRLSRKEFIFWASIWIAIITVTLIPGVATFFANLFDIGRGADVVLYTSVIVLFYVVFLLYSKIEKTEREMTKLVRKIAIEGKDKKQK